jgi:hypothetical protein
LADAWFFQLSRGFPNVPIQPGIKNCVIVTDINAAMNHQGWSERKDYRGSFKCGGMSRWKTSCIRTMKWFVEHPEEFWRMSKMQEHETSDMCNRIFGRATLLMYHKLGK